MSAWPEIPPLAGARRRLVLAWLVLALTALAVSTIFALLLVVARTPFITHWLPTDFFAGALVLHVNLAVTVWFLAFAALWWSLCAPRRPGRMAWSAWGLAVAGVCLQLLARLAGEHRPVLSNYVPVIDGPVFLTGLVLFLIGIALAALRAMGGGGTELQAGARQAARVALLALAVFLGTALALPAAAPPDYENLFWGGGHLLQFTHVLLMLVAWMVLARLAALPAPRFPLRYLFGLAAVPLLCVPAIFLLNPGSEAWRGAWTELMRWGSWPVAAVFGVWLARSLARGVRTPFSPWRSALGLSLLLFGLGLLAGGLIREDNVVVTAHYHGTVGAITLAFMAVTHHLLSRLGLRTAAAPRVRRQLRLYGGGMVLLIGGLLWSGLHGVQRKTPGTAMLDQMQEWIGMLLMGIGGFVGLAATVWFLGLTLRALWPARTVLTPSGRGAEEAG